MIFDQFYLLFTFQVVVKLHFYLVTNKLRFKIILNKTNFFT